jgi:hypothetical protein
MIYVQSILIFMYATYLITFIGNSILFLGHSKIYASTKNPVSMRVVDNYSFIPILHGLFVVAIFVSFNVDFFS